MKYSFFNCVQTFFGHVINEFTNREKLNPANAMSILWMVGKWTEKSNLSGISAPLASVVRQFNLVLSTCGTTQLIDEFMEGLDKYGFIQDYHD